MQKTTTTKLLFFFIILLIMQACNPTKFVGEDEYYLKKNTIENKNKEVDLSGIEAFIKQQPNKKVLFLFRFHLGAYNLFAKKERKKPDGKIKKWFAYSIPNWVENVVGEPPVVVDDFLTKKAVTQMKLYLRNKGYYYVTISDSTHKYRHRRKEIKKNRGQRVEIIYRIDAGTPYRIDSINFLHEVRVSKNLDSLMNEDFTNTLLKKGDNFDIDVLQSERVRITNFLRNQGYYSFAKEYVHFSVDTTIGNRMVDIKVMIKQKKEKLPNSDTYIETDHSLYKINKINIYPAFDAKEAIKLKDDYYDSLRELCYEDLKGYSFFIKEKKIKVNPKVIGSSLLIDSNQLYRQSDVEKTYKRLTAIRTFKLININFTEHKTPEEQYLLDCNIQLSHATKQSLSLELEGSNFSANAGAASNIVYRNKNFLKGAEFLELKMRTALEADPDYQMTGNKRLNTFEAGLSGMLNIPRFMLPFTLINFERKYAPHTNISLSYNYEQSPQITWIKRNASFGYFVQSSDYGKHQLNIIDFNSVKVPADKLTESHRILLDTTYGAYSYESHLVSAVSYSYVFNNQARTANRNSVYFKLNFKSAGNFISGTNMLFNDLDIEEGQYTLFKMQYAQFLKSDIDIRLYHTITHWQKVVFRTFAGGIFPYGNLKSAPYKQRYFSGGANSIRAWKTKDLGPGSFANISTGNPSVVADIKLESNVEFRTKMNKMLELAFFADAGNIWDYKETEERPEAAFYIDKFYQQIAVAAGVGIRFDLSFFVVRLDWAMRLRDPALEQNNRWLNPFNKPGSELNFGIGYPF